MVHVAEAAQTPIVEVVSLTTRASKVADAIRFAEGRCTQGQSGEYGCYQYLPSTWRAYSMVIAGEVLLQTEQNEHKITMGMISKWLNEGMSERGIFLMWNQGSATGWGPGTKDCYSGTNKWGVYYDSCAYAEKGLNYLATH